MGRIVSAGLALSFWLLAAPAAAHDWGALEVAPPSAAQLGAILLVTEQVQADALARGEAPALGRDALAADWLGWLVGAADLDERESLDRLADKMVAAGAVAPAERELAVAAWSHGVEHLALAWDADELGATRALAAQAEARLTDPNLTQEESVRLSYLASLGSLDAAHDPPPAPLLVRLGALVEAARNARGRR